MTRENIFADPLMKDWVVRLAIIIGLFLRIEEAFYEDVEPDALHQWFLAITPELSSIFTDYVSNSGTPHPSASFVLMWFWVKIFGDSVLIMRVPSIIFGILTIVISSLLARDWFGERAGRHTAIMAAIISDFIKISAQARMYSMLVFLCVTLIWLVNKKIMDRSESSPKDYIGIVAVAILLAHTHYFGTMLAFGTIFLAIIYRKISIGPLVSDFFWVMIALVIGFSPHIPFMINHMSGGGDVGYIEQYIQWDLPLVSLSRQLNGSMGIAILAILFVGISLAIKWKDISKERRFGWHCIGFWWLGSLALAMTISLLGPAVASPANLRITLPATIIAISACTSMFCDAFISKNRESAFSFSILVLILLHLIFLHGILEKSNPEIETAFDEVGEKVRGETVVILANSHGLLFQDASGQCRFCDQIEGEIVDSVLIYTGDDWQNDTIDRLSKGSVVIVFELEDWLAEYSDEENAMINSIGEVTWEKSFRQVNSRIIMIQ